MEVYRNIVGIFQLRIMVLNLTFATTSLFKLKEK